ncbi:MAG: hypothetical protein AAFR47_11440, partial [Pseudomonadota bacterium]
MRSLLLAVLLALPGAASAQPLLHQPTESAAPVPLPAAIQAQLDDPFFRIVLERQPDAVSLDAVIATLTEGGRSEFSAFVVGEQIIGSLPTGVTLRDDPTLGIVNGAFVSDDGGHGPTLGNPRAFFDENQQITLTPMVYTGTEYEPKDRSTLTIPYEGDTVISRSSELLISRIAGNNFRQ